MMSSFKIGEGYGATITSSIREIAWFTGTREKGIVELMRSFDGMDIDCAEDIINGKLKIVEDVESQMCDVVEDNWIPPDIVKMKENIDNFVLDVQCAFDDSCDISIVTHFNERGWLQRANYQITGIEESYDYYFSSKRFYLSPVDIYRLDIVSKEIQKIAEENLTKAHKLMQYYLHLHIPQNQAGYKDRLEPSVLHNFMIHQAHNDDYKIEYSEELNRIDSILKLERKLTDITFNNNDKNKILSEFNTIQERLLNAKINGIKVVDDTKEISKPDGWLSPTGHYFTCEAYEHIYLSWELCEQLGYEFEDPTADDVMIQHGWVKCTGKNWILDKHSLTERQIDFLFDWCMKYGKDMKIRINRSFIDYQDIVENYKRID